MGHSTASELPRASSAPTAWVLIPIYDHVLMTETAWESPEGAGFVRVASDLDHLA